VNKRGVEDDADQQEVCFMDSGVRSGITDHGTVSWSGGISVGIGVSELLLVIASLLFYAVPIAIIVVYVISLVKRYVDCKVAESERIVEVDATIERLERQIERVEGKVNEIAEMVGSSSD